MNTQVTHTPAEWQSRIALDGITKARMQTALGLNIVPSWMVPIFLCGLDPWQSPISEVRAAVVSGGESK